MKRLKMKKIWLAVVCFVAVECLAFPQVLFPDCIRKTAAEKNTEKESEDYDFGLYFLKHLKLNEMEYGIWYSK